MKTALVTMLNDDFVIGYRVMMYSLLSNNKWFDLPVVIINDGLSQRSTVEVKSLYDNVIFKDINRRMYADVNFEMTAPRLRSTYYKLDTFSYDEFDRLVFLDVDMVILRDIKPLFDCFQPFTAVRGYDPARDCLRNDINSGVFVVNKPFIGVSTYTDLIGIAKEGHRMPDQTTVNRYFRNKIHYLEKSFNVEKRMQYSSVYRHIYLNARILHFVGEKPWQPKTSQKEEQYKDAERKWWNLHDEQSVHSKFKVC